MASQDGSMRALAYVVLAAGTGRRLSRSGHVGPKWLLPVAGRRIADYQLDGIATAARCGDLGVIVTGFADTEIAGLLAGRNHPAPIETLHNPAWADRNNWFSLLLALEHLEGRTWTGGVVVINSDLCAPPELFTDFLAAARAASAGYPLLAVDFARPVTDEAMKVAGHRGGDGTFRCAQIGKVGVHDAAGEYIGLAAFASPDWLRLLPVLRRFHAPQHHDEWYEAAFQELMESAGSFDAWPTPHSDWVEVDDEQDWQRAGRTMAAR